MRIVRVFHANRLWLSLGLLALLALASGCGGDVNKQAAAPPQSQAEQDKERAAREKAFGKMTIPGKTAK